MKLSKICLSLISALSLTAVTAQGYTWTVINSTEEPIEVKLRTTLLAKGRSQTKTIPVGGTTQFHFGGIQAGACLDQGQIRVRGYRVQNHPGETFSGINVCGNDTIRISGSAREGYLKRKVHN